MRRDTLLFCLSLAVVLWTPRLQAETWCAGRVNYWYTSGAGLVHVLWTGNNIGHMPMCSVNETYRSITPVTCLTWVAELKSHLTKANSVLYIGWSESQACDAAPAPSVIGVMLSNPS